MTVGGSGWLLDASCLHAMIRLMPSPGTTISDVISMNLYIHVVLEDVQWMTSEPVLQSASAHIASFGPQQAGRHLPWVCLACNGMQCHVGFEIKEFGSGSGGICAFRRSAKLGFGSAPDHKSY